MIFFSKERMKFSKPELCCRHSISEERTCVCGILRKRKGQKMTFYFSAVLDKGFVGIILKLGKE